MTNDKEKNTEEKIPQESKSSKGKSLENKLAEKTSEQNSESNSSNTGKGNSFILPALIIVVLLAAGVYVANKLNKFEQNINQQERYGKDVIEDINDRISNASSMYTTVQTRIEEIEVKLDLLSHSLSQPVQQQLHINKDYALAEIEHLLIIADYNLQLDHDVKTALSAMQAADARLQGLDSPNLLEVRKQLIADMNQLRSLNQTDLSGMGLFLSALINDVDKLPLKEDIVVTVEKNNAPVKKPETEGVIHFFKLVWQELKSLVVITRDTDVSKARLLPDEIYFLRANIKLELANARFAVFNRDTENLHASIEHIQDWLNEYFDLSDASALNIYDSLARMKKLELTFPELDISSSLESVRALIRQQDSNNNSEEELVPPQ